MYTKQFVSAVCGLAAVANAQLPTPSTTAGIPVVEGALSYDGPAVNGFTGPGGNATVQTGNPQATYIATFPAQEFANGTGTNVVGTVTAMTGPSGTGVSFNINLSGLPSVAQYGPFVYHIHAAAVPAGGNCTATGAHLDPTQRGELHACEVAAPQTCQAGDLAGKHGNITTQAFSTMYTDNYLSTTPGSPYFFGDKSIVVHTSNATRLACANFVLQSGASSTTNGTSPSSNGTGVSSSTPTPSTTAVSTGGAGVLGVSAGLLIGALALFL